MTRKTPLINELKTRRQLLGWTHQELGQQCGIDYSALDAWERGFRSPDLDAVEQWAEALGVRIAVVPAESEKGQGLKVDWHRRQVSVDGTPLRLTPMEWKALERLAWSPGELVTHHELFQHLYGDNRHYETQSTAVRVLITKLRRLLPIRIDARWGKGYVISGIAAARPGTAASEAAAGGERQCQGAMRRDEARPERACMPRSTQRDLPPLPRKVIDLANSGARRHATQETRPGLCRSDELGVIERFLAERGATRCPDVATIQHSPLPTLIWDKNKRKWVRPSLGSNEAH